MTLEELLEIDSRKLYSVRHQGIMYGSYFDNLEKANQQKDLVDNTMKERGSLYSSIIEEVSGWQEEITEFNGAEYMEAAMKIIKKLKSDLEISQELVRELLEYVVEIEERYEQ